MSEIVTGEAVSLDLRVARLGTRCLSRGIDIVAQGAALLVVEFALARAGQGLDADAGRAIALVLLACVVLGYPIVWETLGHGRTLGKLVVGLRAVGVDGGPIRFRQALVRAVTAVIEIWILVGVPAVITSLLTERAQRLGDLFAGTLVVFQRAPTSAAPPASMPEELRDWAAGLDVSALPDDVVMLARSYLGRLDKLDPRAREAMGVHLATTMAAHVAPQPPPGTAPVDYLSAVLAERTKRAKHAADPAGRGIQVRPGHPAGSSTDSTPPPDRTTAPGDPGFAPPN